MTARRGRTDLLLLSMSWGLSTLRRLGEGKEEKGKGEKVSELLCRKP